MTDVFTTTRLANQAVAEHVLSAALHAANGHIGLRRTPGGFGTPRFGDGDVHQLRVEGTELVVADASGERRATITTLRAAGELVGIEPGAPASVYTPSTPLDLDAPLPIDATAAARLAAVYAVTDDALTQLRARFGELTGEDPPIAQLWPEHFDLAAALGECNYGGSPGDAANPRPYLYVGPWNPPPVDDFWNEPFGASIPLLDTTTAGEALAFFTEGLRRLTSG